LLTARRLAPVEKLNPQWIAEAIGRQTKPIRTMEWLTIDWHRWRWYFLWGFFVLAACSQIYFETASSTKFATRFIYVIVASLCINWLILPLTTHLGAIATGNALQIAETFRWRRKLALAGVGAAILAAHASATLIVARSSEAGLLTSLFFICFSALIVVPKPQNGNYNLTSLLACHSITLMLAAFSLVTYFQHSTMFEGFFAAFLVAAFFSNLFIAILLNTTDT
jgi:hypothetical protein